MEFTFKVDRPENLETVFSKAKSDAEKHNISWSGDIQRGKAEGSGFEGSYVVDSDGITICIIKKPAFVSKAKIEKEVRRYLMQA
ncbi:MAG: hypothetical protein FWC96_05350 [Oscillospiraceae bacterium]|nr:hypothetical protein [Oscillospiraceae bacterium]